MTDRKKHLELRRKLRRDATFPERLLWSKLRRKQLGFNFRRQHSIGPYIVDFFCKEIGIIIEIDGIHHTYPEIIKYDKRRNRWLMEQGFNVIHYSDQEVNENLEGVWLDIQKQCRTRNK